MLVKIKLEKWLGQVPPPAFQGCDSLQHPSPLSQLFSARLCSFGRNSSSHCGIWHGTCGHGRHRAMGDGVSSPPWPRSLRRGLPKGRFPDCGVECAAPPEVWRTELSICKQAASILGQLGTACQEMGFRWEGSPCSPFYNLISVCVWIDFPPLSKFFCLFLNPTKFSMSWYGYLLPNPLTALKSKLQQAPVATNCYFHFHRKLFFFNYFFSFLRKPCQSLHLLFNLRTGKVHHYQYVLTEH